MGLLAPPSPSLSPRTSTFDSVDSVLYCLFFFPFRSTTCGTWISPPESGIMGIDGTDFDRSQSFILIYIPGNPLFRGADVDYVTRPLPPGLSSDAGYRSVLPSGSVPSPTSPLWNFASHAALCLSLRPCLPGMWPPGRPSFCFTTINDRFSLSRLSPPATLPFLLFHCKNRASPYVFR